MSSGKRRNPLGLSLPPTVNEDGTTGDKVGSIFHYLIVLTILQISCDVSIDRIRNMIDT